MISLALYAPLLAAAVVLVWRRPILALYAFVVGLAAHNLVMALLYGAGVRGAELTAIQAWKEALLAAALLSVAWRSVRAGRLPFRPGLVDVLALGFAAVVVVYALVPQDVLDGEAGPRAIAQGLRHALLPVAAYVLGRSLVLDAAQLRRFGWTIVGAAACVAAIGLAEVYLVSLDWWRRSGAVGWFRDQLDLEYRGLSGLPENFVYNTGDERPLRRLVSTFLSPLATAYMLAAAIVVSAAWRGLTRLHALVPLLVAGLLWTYSRSTFVALAAGVVVVAVAARRVSLVATAAAFLALAAAFVEVFPEIGPRTSFTPAELAVQRAQAREAPGVSHDPFSAEESSIASHWRNLRDGLETVGRHPQGYGLGNAGAVAKREHVPLKAGESNYAELGVETGIAGLALFLAWNVALLWALVRVGRAGDWAAAALAGALATVLVVGVQTDAFGVPWLAYCVWGLGGAVAAPAALRLTRPRRPPITAPLPDVSRAGRL